MSRGEWEAQFPQEHIPDDLASSDFLKVLDRLSTKASEGLEDPNHTPGEGLQAWP